MTPSRRSEWERQHSQFPGKRWLGTPPADVVEALCLSGILDRCEHGGAVLEFGIGSGEFCRLMADRGFAVTAVDVSAIGLQSVSEFSKTCLTTEMPSLPSDSIDLAVSFLAFQHIPDSELAWVIQHLVRAMKPRGTLAFQFAHVHDPAGEVCPVFRADIANGHVFSHSPERINEMVVSAGGSLEWACGPTNPVQGVWWHYAHVSKVEGETCERR